MYKNLFISNNKIDTVLDKKVLQNDFYSKYYVRTFLLKTSDLVILDNNKNFLNITLKKIFKYFKLKGKNVIGRSLIVNDFLYSKKLKFNYTRIKTSLSYQNFLKDYYYHFNSLTSNTTNVSFFLLKSLKGGYLCICQGFVGFLPRPQLKYLFLSMFQKSSRSISSSYLNLFVLLFKSTHTFWTLNDLKYDKLSLKKGYVLFQPIGSNFAYNKYKNKTIYSKKIRRKFKFKMPFITKFTFFYVDPLLVKSSKYVNESIGSKLKKNMLHLK